MESKSSTATALVIVQADPTLSPDNVKCRLMASAKAAVAADGQMAYSIFQQGAGLVNAVDAVNNTAVNCANLGLDMDADLNGTAHFGGLARPRGVSKPLWVFCLGDLSSMF